MLTIKPATHEDAGELASVMRDEDAEEGFAVYGLKPKDSLSLSLTSSTAAYTARLDGEVVAMWGARPWSHGVGLVWSKYAKSAMRHPKLLVAFGRQALRLLLEHFHLLVGLIDGTSRKARRWSEWLGFEVRAEKVAGPNGKTLQPILARRDTCLYGTS